MPTNSVNRDVIAGIVTFNPELGRLSENLQAISHQVSQVAIFDNGSDEIRAVEELAGRWANTKVIRGGKNYGIAHGLNRLLDEAARSRHPFILTLDQDSVASRGMVQALRSVVGGQIAMATPFIVDRNKTTPAAPKGGLPRIQEYRHPARRGAITSGALLSVEAARAVGGFDAELFIDYVDYDLNARLMINGYRIVRVNAVQMLHEVGRANYTWLVTPRRDVDGTWRVERFYTFGHTADRCYYKARNRVIFTKKYGRYLGLSHEGVWQLPQQIILTLLFEEQRREKLRSFVRGAFDGFRYDAETVPRLATREHE